MATGADHTKPTDRRARRPLGARRRHARSGAPSRTSRRGSLPRRELSALYERERRRWSTRSHQARATERAPAALRARIEAARPSRRDARPAGGSSTAVASPARSRPSCSRSCWCSRRERPARRRCPTRPRWPRAGPMQAGAGARSGHARRRGCNESVGDVYFPNWASRVRTGARSGSASTARRADRA